MRVCACDLPDLSDARAAPWHVPGNTLDAEVVALARALEVNSTLKTLRLDGMPCGGEGKNAGVRSKYVLSLSVYVCVRVCVCVWPGRGENWLARGGGGSWDPPEGGGGGVWQWGSCDRTLGKVPITSKRDC